MFLGSWCKICVAWRHWHQIDMDYQVEHFFFLLFITLLNPVYFLFFKKIQSKDVSREASITLKFGHMMGHMLISKVLIGELQAPTECCRYTYLRPLFQTTRHTECFVLPSWQVGSTYVEGCINILQFLISARADMGYSLKISIPQLFIVHFSSCSFCNRNSSNHHVPGRELNWG